MELTKLQAWLSAFPGFAGKHWEWDCLPHKPGMVTLTPKGIRSTKNWQDLLGNCKRTMEYTCMLAFSGTNKAQTLLDLQHWVAFQDALGLCPRFSQGKQTISLSDGKHLKENKLGLDIYTAQLTVTYEIFYEVNENGEN